MYKSDIESRKYQNNIIKIDKTKGSIEIGKEADLVLFDKDININTTIINGKVVYKKTH